MGRGGFVPPHRPVAVGVSPRRLFTSPEAAGVPGNTSWYRERRGPPVDGAGDRVDPVASGGRRNARKGSGPHPSNGAGLMDALIPRANRAAVRCPCHRSPRGRPHAPYGARRRPASFAVMPLDVLGRTVCPRPRASVFDVD